MVTETFVPQKFAAGSVLVMTVPLAAASLAVWCSANSGSIFFPSHDSGQVFSVFPADIELLLYLHLCLHVRDMWRLCCELSLDESLL